MSAESLRSAMGITLQLADPGGQGDNEGQSQEALTHLSSEDEQPPDHVDRDLQDFFEQGPNLHVCDSPSLADDAVMVVDSPTPVAPSVAMPANQVETEQAVAALADEANQAAAFIASGALL